ncbi:MULTISPECIES: GTPase Era [Caloramator]|uniref:GTPase Era n=1 Tax=Caloramator proteoclasticus DSM 10124 TaxID=1121262 RepID=A0A1M4WWS8_9CLOT|nr:MULTISPECIES: GTPase Era [Caloramator]SHE85655.1 GTP-binding protein Era [Caloramator proteoclasticus DSM 10124]
MNNDFKSGYVTIVGRPNVGKSTLINSIMGEKLLITSNKPQTTRNTIQAILTKDNYQIVFMDTPGLHKPKHKLGEYMVKVAQSTLSQVDVVVFVTTPEEELNIGDKYIIDQIKNSNSRKILVINKVDTVSKEKIAKTIDTYYNYFAFDEVVPISALKQKNIDELIKVIVNNLPYGPKYFPDDMITDQPERFVVAEIIREKLLHNLQEEVPHGTAVEIVTMKEDKDKNCININATIYCEKDSHKAIIIGKGGQMLKKIGQSARIEIERFLGSSVYLELWVKVKKDWRDSDSILKSLGYK